jgi:hypothetical protein
MSTFQGFAPSWYYNPGTEGLGIYVAPGNINGVLYDGQVVTIAANSTVYVYVDDSGIAHTGGSVPGGDFGVALVVSGQVLTSSLNLGQYENGILSIGDIRE